MPPAAALLKYLPGWCGQPACAGGPGGWPPPAPAMEMAEQGELVRGVPVRLAIERPTVRCELQLDERSLFFPAMRPWPTEQSRPSAAGRNWCGDAP